jgi:hypothetical protein
MELSANVNDHSRCRSDGHSGLESIVVHVYGAFVPSQLPYSFMNDKECTGCHLALATDKDKMSSPEADPDGTTALFPTIHSLIK